MYATEVGDFFVYPKERGGWVVIWEPVMQGRRFNDMVAQVPDRVAAIGWVEAALSFA
jgi:hypothetical protein